MRGIMTDLAAFIQSTPMMDTHEHMLTEAAYLEAGPDILQCLFNNYALNDLVSAGASDAAVRRLVDKKDPDVRGRFMAVRDAWDAMQFTGYGEGVRLIARHVFGMDEITAGAIESAAPMALALIKPGERLRLLRDVACLDHIQTDNFELKVSPDASGPDFFLYDISWWRWARGDMYADELTAEAGIEVRDAASLHSAFEAVFEKSARMAIAVKSQHAYNRTLQWQKRDDADVELIIKKRLKNEVVSEAEANCLGDWALARAAELCAMHNLPLKIHTGYAAGNRTMQLDRMRALHLSPLLVQYPDTRFVLMHNSYPHDHEIAALAKHFPNAWVDMCWAWSIDPHSAVQFIRRMIHAVPANKLFVFGGDSWLPSAVVGYAIQARAGLTRALQAEVDEGQLNEKQAVSLAQRFMQGNQRACFDLEGTRAAIRASSPS
jgi:uncharacterized protein